MLYGNLRGFAEALINRDKYKADGELRSLADAIISGDKYKAPNGQLRDLADAIISRDKYKVAGGPLRDFADALISGDKYKAPNGLREVADAIISGDKYKVSSGGCFVATAVYGTPDASDVFTLRQFRDDILVSSSVGRMLIAVYYRLGPYAASIISKSSLAKKSIRYILIKPLVNVIKYLRG